MAELLDAPASAFRRGPKWNIELVGNPDRILAEYPGVVATTDSAILDRGVSWIGLSRKIIDSRIPNAWTIDLRISQHGVS